MTFGGSCSAAHLSVLGNTWSRVGLAMADGGIRSVDPHLEEGGVMVRVHCRTLRRVADYLMRHCSFPIGVAYNADARDSDEATIDLYLPLTSGRRLYRTHGGPDDHAHPRRSVRCPLSLTAAESFGAWELQLVFSGLSSEWASIIQRAEKKRGTSSLPGPDGRHTVSIVLGLREVASRSRRAVLPPVAQDATEVRDSMCQQTG